MTPGAKSALAPWVAEITGMPDLSGWPAGHVEPAHPARQQGRQARPHTEKAAAAPHHPAKITKDAG
jgi:hypothetical protein